MIKKKLGLMALAIIWLPIDFIWSLTKAMFLFFNSISQNEVNDEFNKLKYKPDQSQLADQHLDDVINREKQLNNMRLRALMFTFIFSPICFFASVVSLTLCCITNVFENFMDAYYNEHIRSTGSRMDKKSTIYFLKKDKEYIKQLKETVMRRCPVDNPANRFTGMNKDPYIYWRDSEEKKNGRHYLMF